MNSKLQANQTLTAVLWPDRSLPFNIMLVLAGSWLIALTAQLTIPLWPVPVTGQTFGVLLVAALLGSRLGPASVITYLAQGALGLPFFAGGAAGVGVLVGATGGYLTGFVAAAFVVGLLAERGWDRQSGKCVLMMLLGTAVIYLFGVSWLARFIGLEAALSNGLVPFIPGDVIKAVLAAIMLPLGWKLLRKK